MYILAFDTSYGKCSVALSKNDMLIEQISIFEDSVQAEKLVPTIEQILSNNNLNYQNIDYIATTTGPGSFTGIRIGLATARALSLASNIKPIAMTSFDLINFRINEHFKNYDYSIAVINAYRNQCYYLITDTKNKKVTTPLLIENKDFNQVINNLNGNIVISGSALINLPLRSDITYLPRFPYPEARIMCRLAYTLISTKSYNSTLEPLYIRPPDAKISIK